MKITNHVLKQLGFEEVGPNNFKKMFRVADKQEEVSCVRDNPKGAWTIITSRCRRSGYWRLEYLIEAICTDTFILGREGAKKAMRDALEAWS